MAKKKVIAKENSEVGYKKPPKQHQFKKGVINNRGITVSKVKRALKTLTEEELGNAIKMVFTSTEKECKQLLKDPATTLGHKVILRAAIDAAHHGNYSKFNEILERVIGKVPNKTDVTTKGESLNVTSDDKVKIAEMVRQAQNDF